LAKRKEETNGTERYGPKTANKSHDLRTTKSEQKLNQTAQHCPLSLCAYI